jgi:hypothetical protein
MAMLKKWTGGNAQVLRQICEKSRQSGERLICHFFPIA